LYNNVLPETIPARPRFTRIHKYRIVNRARKPALRMGGENPYQVPPGREGIGDKRRASGVRRVNEDKRTINVGE
jgi:hypothetical protein